MRLYLCIVPSPWPQLKFALSGMQPISVPPPVIQVWSLIGRKPRLSTIKLHFDCRCAGACVLMSNYPSTSQSKDQSLVTREASRR